MRRKEDPSEQDSWEEESDEEKPSKTPKKNDNDREMVDVEANRFKVQEESSQYPCHSSDADERSEGFGHVEFATLETTQKALNMNDRDLLGYAVRHDLPYERGHAYSMQRKRKQFIPKDQDQGN